MVALLHLANVLYLLSYLVKNVMALRLLTVVATVLLIVYFLILHLWGPVAWNLVFISINLHQILIYRRNNKNE